jgi:Protein of unknown function (DUF1566)
MLITLEILYLFAKSAIHFSCNGLKQNSGSGVPVYFCSVNAKQNLIRKPMKNIRQNLFFFCLPVSLLLVTGCGDEDVAEAHKIEVGKEHLGGIIFYLDSSGEHGLIAAKTDINTLYSWWNGVYMDIPAANGNDLGTGQSNTTAIITAQGAGNYAASMCASYAVGEYDDWYLPSKNELNLMYNELHLKGLGNFTEALYWSSTTFNEATAWYQDFGDCCPGFNDRKVAYRIRPIQSF